MAEKNYKINLVFLFLTDCTVARYVTLFWYSITGKWFNREYMKNCCAVMESIESFGMCKRNCIAR